MSVLPVIRRDPVIVRSSLNGFDTTFERVEPSPSKLLALTVSLTVTGLLNVVSKEVSKEVYTLLGWWETSNIGKPSSAERFTPSNLPPLLKDSLLK